MIDSHCHLDRCGEGAADNDLTAMVTVGTDPERCREAVATAEADPRVWAAVGIHPNEASRVADPEVRAAIEALADHPRVVAIGETGFDTHWDAESLEAQQASFDWHAELAASSGKPLILHVRDAQGREDASVAAAEALRGAEGCHGILHCFGGHADLLRVGLDLGWMVSFAGNVTFKNAEALRRSAASVPEDRLMVETDSPFLAPVPMRGRPNRPAYVAHTARVLADVRHREPGAMEAVLDANAARVYGLPS